MTIEDSPQGTRTEPSAIKVERARVFDVPQIHRLINHFADRGEMLQRSLSELYENLRDFLVVRNGEQVVGCVALHLNWGDLAELRSLAVAEDWQGRGVGEALSRACIEEAQRLGVTVVYALTYQPRFFEKVGFRLVEKAELPRKVWGECYRCPQFPVCDEIALIYPVFPLPEGGLSAVGGPEHIGEILQGEALLRWMDERGKDPR